MFARLPHRIRIERIPLRQAVDHFDALRPNETITFFERGGRPNLSAFLVPTGRERVGFIREILQ